MHVPHASISTLFRNEITIVLISTAIDFDTCIRVWKWSWLITSVMEMVDILKASIIAFQKSYVHRYILIQSILSRAKALCNYTCTNVYMYKPEMS